MATMTPKHRVVISHVVYQALRAEALVKQSSPQAILDTLILGNISQEAKAILKTLGTQESVDNEAITPQRQQSTQAGRPRQLARDKKSVAQIKELWASTDLSITDIAAKVDAPRQTVDGLIKRLIERGELAQRGEPGH